MAAEKYSAAKDDAEYLEEREFEDEIQRIIQRGKSRKFDNL